MTQNIQRSLYLKPLNSKTTFPSELVILPTSLPSTPPLSLLDDPHFLPPIPQPYSSQTLLLTTSRYLERQQKDPVKITWSNFVEKNGMRFYRALERQVRDQIKRTSDTTRRDTLEWMTKSTS